MRQAFTLVELMIVVAIIGILAAIAVPAFVEMQYRAKRAEVPANVDGIKTAEMAYDAAFDEFIAVSPYPPSLPGKVPVPWLFGNVGYKTLGWWPDGDVRGQYWVTTTPPSSSTPGGDIQVNGICDVDGDGNTAEYTATKSINSIQNTANDIY